MNVYVDVAWSPLVKELDIENRLRMQKSRKFLQNIRHLENCGLEIAPLGEGEAFGAVNRLIDPVDESQIAARSSCCDAKE